jgi:hypothetical protein
VNQSKKNVLPFPGRPEDPAPSTIICQVGNERFAIHWEVEELPPVSPLLGVNKVTPKRTKRRSSPTSIEAARRRKGE